MGIYNKRSYAEVSIRQLKTYFSTALYALPPLWPWQLMFLQAVKPDKTKMAYKRDLRRQKSLQLGS